MGRRSEVRPNRRKRALLERIQQCPGMTDAFLAKSFPSAMPFLKELEEEGAVFSHRFDWSESVFWYPRGHNVERLFRHSSNQPELKTWIDLSQKTEYFPTRAAIEDLPTTVNWRTEMPDETKLQKFKSLCDRYVREGSIPPAAQVSREAGALSNWVHSEKEALAYYRQSIQKIKSEAQEAEEANSPSSVQTIVALEEKIHRLEQEAKQKQQTISDLEDRNRELRQQVSELQNQSQQPRLVEVAVPLNYFRQQLQSWRENVAELETDFESAKANLAAYERLVKLHEVEDPIDLDAVNLTLNGNSSKVMGGDQ